MHCVGNRQAVDAFSSVCDQRSPMKDPSSKRVENAHMLFGLSSVSTSEKTFSGHPNGTLLEAENSRSKILFFHI